MQLVKQVLTLIFHSFYFIFLLMVLAQFDQNESLNTSLEAILPALICVCSILPPKNNVREFKQHHCYLSR